MRHVFLFLALSALPCLASSPVMPDTTQTEQHSICQLKHCDCTAFELAQVPELGPSSQACTCGHAPAVHGERAHITSGSIHASGSSAFTIERDMSTINTVRAKCRVVSTKHASGCHGYSATQKEPYAIEVTLQPVYGAGDDTENKSWSKYTPSGELKLVITNPDAVAVLGLGKTFYVDFTPVEPLGSGEAAG